MQNRYTADVGDFAKYALLRQLCGLTSASRVRLGVVWCLFPDEGHNNDGRHVSYVRSTDFVGLDPELLKALGTILGDGDRSISSVMKSTILPQETVFYSASPFGPVEGPSLRSDRLRYREDWLRAGARVTTNCDLVFFDPDNGIEISSVPKHHRLAGKYIYWDELALFWDRGQSLLVYHHLNRTMSAAQQVDRLLAQFEKRFEHAIVRPLVFRRGSCRVFWLIHRGSVLGRCLEKRAADMLRSNWSNHFRPFGWPREHQADAGTR